MPKCGKDGSSGLPDMKLQRAFVSSFALAALAFSSVAALLRRGIERDGGRSVAVRPIAGATVAAVNDVGIIVQQITDDRGGFDFNVSPPV